MRDETSVSPAGQGVVTPAAERRRPVFDMIRRRSVAVDFNEYHLLRSLTFFEDAETEPMPRMLRRVAWPVIKKTIVAEVRRLS